MEKDLEKYLCVLYSEKCLEKPKEASIVIDKIIDCFNQKQSQFSIGLLVGKILDDGKIFTCIWKAAAKFETVPYITAAFRLLDFLVTNFEKCTEPYFPMLFQKSLHLLDTKFAKIKEVLIKLVRKLIVADSKNSLDLSMLTVRLKNYLKEETKIPGSVAEQVFGLLGYIFEKYPHTVDNEEWFFQNICEWLRKDLTVLKVPNSSRQTGAFEGMNGYLVSFKMPPEECKKVYEYVKSSSSFRPDQRKVCRAALKIVQNHWKYFLSEIYIDRFFWKKIFEVWMKQTSEDRICAFGALQSFYNVMALCLKHYKSPVDKFIKDFDDTLNGESDFYEKAAALIGFKFFCLTNCLANDFDSAYSIVMNFVHKYENINVYLPSCIECLSAFEFRLKLRDLSCLERLSIKIFKNYPEFEKDSKALTALERSFYFIGLSNMETLQDHIGRILYQGLLNTCSAMTQREYEHLKESGSTPDSYTYKSYLSLWKYFLDLRSTPNMPMSGSVCVKNGVAIKVFDTFVESFLRILSKLNYTMSGTDVDNASDVRIFINCVDLYEDIVQENDYIQKWANTILSEAIKLSYKNPLVAGFYKIVTKTLKVADCECFILDKFLESVLLKVDLYKGELQIACLKTILASPINLIQRYLDKVLPAVEVAVQIGKGCFSLLRDVIEELERWNRRLPPSVMETLMQKILPHFDIFFQSQHFRGDDLVDSSIVGKKLKNEVYNDSELLTLQKKFLIFLGQLDLNKSVHLIQLPETERDITDKRLIYYIPFLNGKTELDVDELLPRVIDLAVSCSDSDTRITACELLYSIIMIILGNINQLSGGYSSVFRKIIKTTIPLACDSDDIVIQIYKPLMYQIMHYFSSKKALNFTETNDLIDILFDYVTKPYDMTLRDFSAILLKEFIEWTINQHTPEELKTTPEIIKRILRKMYSLALHPSYNKRQGAAIVFNKIYTILRQESYILSENWFELFYYFMESLRMCDGPEDVSEIISAIQHIKRPLVEKRAEFNTSGNRITPPEFNGPLLEDLVTWTVDRCGDVKTHVRRLAMSLVEELVPVVVYRYKIADIFPQPPDLQVPPMHTISSIEEYKNWLKTQMAFFEYMSWLAKHDVIPAENVYKLQSIAITNFAKSIAEPQGIEKETVLSFLNLLYTLRERAFYFPVDFWDIIKMCIFKPIQLGFDLSHSSAAEDLSQILTKLMLHLYNKMPEHYFNYFYDGLESVITVPVFKFIVRNKQLGIVSKEFLFSLKIARSANFWGIFTKNFQFRGVVRAIFKSLFHKEGQNIVAVMLESACKKYFEEVLKFFIDEEIIFECLDDKTEVKDERTIKFMTKGLYFWITFKQSLYGFLKVKSLIERRVNGFKMLIDAVENCEDTAKDALRSWNYILQKFENKENVLKIALAIGTGINTLGCLKSTPISHFITYLDKSHHDTVLKLLPYLSKTEEENNEALLVCLSKIEKSTNFIKSLLLTLKQTGSLVVLQFILNNVTWFEDSERKDIESALGGFDTLTVPHCVKALRLTHSFCFGLPSTSSISVIHQLFFLPMLKIFKKEAVFEIMVENMANFSFILSTPWNPQNLISAKTNMVRKICTANMLQVFVTRFTNEELKAMPREKAAIMNVILKESFFTLKELSPPQTLNEKYRKLMCEMFNMISFLISVRRVEEKFYELFIFDERGSFLYKAINEKELYTLNMEFSESPRRSQHPTIIHCDAFTPMKYAQINTLFSSSLKEDITRFDLTYASIRPQTTQMIELEMDVFNSHECMPVLVAVISKMVLKGPHPSEEIPCWLKFFLFILNSEQLSNNHKLFVLKAMYNVQEYVKPYSEKIFSTVLNCISLFDIYPINYFLTDVIEMMLKWEKFPADEKSRRQLTQLVITLIEKCDFFRRDIVKYNIGIIKCIIETWKNNLYVEELSSAVIQRLRTGSEENRVTAGFDSFVFISLHTAGILLANNIPPWKPDCEEEFFNILLNSFQEKNKVKELYAEICGIALSYLKRNDKNVNLFASAVCKAIEKESLDWLSLLYNVHKHYPKIVGSFASKIFSSAWTSNDSWILKKLEMLLSHVSEPEVDCTFLCLADGFLIDMMNSVDPPVQEVSLQIVIKMLDKFSGDKVLKEALRLQRSIHIGVRKWVYEIAKKMIHKYPDHCRIVLLRGLNESGELKEPCLNFWKSMEITSPVEIFRQMYSPETEDIFLSNTAQILLHNAGGKYETYIFQNPIIESSYQKRKLWRGTLHMHTNQSVEFTATASYIQQSLPNFPLSSQPTVEPHFQDATVASTIPRNPYKRRFCKTHPKNIKQEKLVERQEVSTYGEYADGDYPDIKIRHDQMLRLLEALSERDHHIARLLMVSLCNGMVSEDMSDFFEEVLKKSTSFHPAMIGFVLQVVYKRGFSIDDELITNAALSSNWFSLGALIIEDSIGKNDIEETQSKRRRGGQSREESRWLELAKLYKNLEEYDVLTGIFLDKLTVAVEARLGLQAETFLDYQTASNHYQRFLNSSPESSQNEFFTETYFNCLEKLSDWSSLNVYTRSTVKNLEDLWTNSNSLSRFLRSEMMVTLGSDKNSFKTTMDDFCQKKSKLSVLEANFGKELTVYDWLSGKLHKSNSRIDQLCSEFLTSWSNINQWAYNLRLTKLGSLQELSELSHSVKTLMGEEMQPHWESMPSLDDDLTIWDVRLSYRREFLKQRKDLTAFGAKANLALAKAALAQGNLSLSEEYMRRASPHLTPELKDEYDYCFKVGKLLLAKRKLVDINLGLETYMNIHYELLEEIQGNANTNSNSMMNSYLALGQLFTEFSLICRRNDIGPEFTQGLLMKLQGDDINKSLKKQGFEYFEQAIFLSEKIDAPIHSESDIYGRFINYILQVDYEHENLGKYILKAMSLGNRDARELFGVVIQKEIPFAESESDKVPSWMFIMWINQILAALDSTLFPRLKSIILRIANDHPSAIRFAYRFISKSKNPQIKFLFDHLNQMLSNRLFDEFLTSISYLAPPDVILRRYLEYSLRGDSQAVLKDLHKIMFSPEFDNFRGVAFKYWDAFRQPIENAMEENDEEKLKQNIERILNSIEKPPSKRVSLEFYSPWLHKFHSIKATEVLEIPGQYSNNQPVTNPVTITSFRSDILKFDTKCQPIRITLLGNDAKEHRFLIKFGEDLKQDERVQQLFGHFNYRLTQSKQTKRYHISTYKIIPLNDHQGMIQWVDDHVSLYDMIRNSLADPKQIARSQKAHIERISAISPIHAHLVAYETIKREISIANFNVRVHDFPKDLLKRAFMQLSTSPEQFVYLRENFASSHAIMSITHWLIGIGDRHLQNTLISTKTGHTLGIDFGYAFGFATHLTPPELIPFRLTPQILNMMHPFEESGWIKQKMVHSLRAFRKEPSGLRAILEVFIRDPVIDWLKEAKKSGRCNADEAWEPKERVAIVERKLMGANPVAVVEADLRLGHSQNPCLEKFVEVLKGEVQENVRARLGEDGLSEEEQVECLIDLATDPHVLGKTYVGWNPWL